eukprot:Opistho-2@28250
MRITNNPILARISGLQSLATIECIGTNQMGSKIMRNDSLATLDGLASLQTLTMSLEIRFNPLLRNLDGLRNVQGVASTPEANNAVDCGPHGCYKGFYVTDNDKLANITGLRSLQTVYGPLTIQRNSALCVETGLAANFTLRGIAVSLTDNASPSVCATRTSITCDPTCSTCTGSSPTECVSCNGSGDNVLDGGRCVPVCQALRNCPVTSSSAALPSVATQSAIAPAVTQTPLAPSSTQPPSCVASTATSFIPVTVTPPP